MSQNLRDFGNWNHFVAYWQAKQMLDASRKFALEQMSKITDNFAAGCLLEQASIAAECKLLVSKLLEAVSPRCFCWSLAYTGNNCCRVLAPHAMSVCFKAKLHHYKSKNCCVFFPLLYTLRLWCMRSSALFHSYIRTWSARPRRFLDAGFLLAGGVHFI